MPNNKGDRRTWTVVMLNRDDKVIGYYVGCGRSKYQNLLNARFASEGPGRVPTDRTIHMPKQTADGIASELMAIREARDVNRGLHFEARKIGLKGA